MVEASRIPGLRVTVMGLGLHGGGLASARFFARRGAEVTVTDLRGPEVLQPSLDGLAALPVRLVLGRHEERDFAHAEVVIKNPAVPPSSPFLRAAREAGAAIETDLSVFLALAANPVIGVTGTKGKSTTASAILAGLERVAPGARLGGNITVSPLDFLDDLAPRDPVVLELSSWQLGDLAGRGLLRPSIAALTVILPDHLDKYPDMKAYVADKLAIVREQGSGDHAIFNRDDPRQATFATETRAAVSWYSATPLSAGAVGAWLEGGDGLACLAPGRAPRAILGETRLAGEHNRMNLLCAGLALSLYGVKAEVVRRALAGFAGIEHRLELFLEREGIRYWNDSAATMPDAAAAALRALEGPVVLVAGGTDKNLAFAPLAEASRGAAAIVLLPGTATEKLRALLDAAGTPYEGPFDDLRRATARAIELARALRDAAAAGRSVSVLLSPGCASFGLFLNEFDRGRRFKETVRDLAG